jgi:hypothetical protein
MISAYPELLVSGGKDAEIHGPAFTTDRAVEQAGYLGDVRDRQAGAD